MNNLFLIWLSLASIGAFFSDWLFSNDTKAARNNLTVTLSLKQLKKESKVKYWLGFFILNLLMFPFSFISYFDEHIK